MTLVACPKVLSSSAYAGALLCLAAAKSRVGHTETAAGAIGISRTLEALGAAAQAPVQHLTDVNAYICTTLDAVAKDSALSTSVARQVGFPVVFVGPKDSLKSLCKPGVWLNRAA